MTTEGAAHEYEVRDSRQIYAGRVIALRRDEVVMPGGVVAVREVVEHPGAVGVVALDDHDQVAMVIQYRHPMAQRLWELPAGLLDIPGEPAHVAAARELIEEAGLEAASWHVLVDTLPSPGMTDEAIRIFLARELRSVPRPIGEHEETEMEQAWLPLDEAVRRVLAGEIRNAMACNGLLAAAASRAVGFTGLRPADAAWPDRRT